MRKKILCWALAAMLAVSATALAEEEETDLSGNQRKATIMVLSITGNEMTYIELETEQSDEEESELDASAGDGGEDMAAMGDSIRSMMAAALEAREEEDGTEAGEDGEIPTGGDGAANPMMENMQNMMESVQDGDVDMSQMAEMMGQMMGAAGGAQSPDAAGEESGEAGGTAEGEDETEAGEDGEAAEDSGTAGDAVNPMMENMQNMMESVQDGDVDMSQMAEMMEQMMGAAGDAQSPDVTGEDGEIPAGGDGAANPMMENMQNMMESIQDGDVDMSEMMGQMMENAAEIMGGDSQTFDTSMAGAETVYLPVSLVVHADGREKTFSILEAGDELEALFEMDDEGNEVITEMWLLDTN